MKKQTNVFMFFLAPIAFLWFITTISMQGPQKPAPKPGSFDEQAAIIAKCNDLYSRPFKTFSSHDKQIIPYCEALLPGTVSDAQFANIKAKLNHRDTDSDAIPDFLGGFALGLIVGSVWD